MKSFTSNPFTSRLIIFEALSSLFICMNFLSFLVYFCLINLSHTFCFTMKSVPSRVYGGFTLRTKSTHLGSSFMLKRFNSKVKNSRLYDLEPSSQDICDKIERSVLEGMFEHNIGKSKTTCLLSVSGGSDSIAMMHILCAIKEAYKTNIMIEIVNFNHKIRPESDEEVN